MNISLPTSIISNISLTINNNDDENNMNALMKLQSLIQTKKLAQQFFQVLVVMVTLVIYIHVLNRVLIILECY